MTPLEGKVAIVTGGGSGIGRASAAALAAAGASVVVGDITEGAAADVAAMIESDGGSAVGIRVDVTDPGSCAALTAVAVEHFGAVDVLHANAGVALVGQDGFTPDIEVEVWDRMIAVNLSGVFYCCRAAIPLMRPGASIVMTASSQATLPNGLTDAYAASKAGVVGLAKSLAVGCGRLGIRVNAVGPGYVDTPMNELIWGNGPLKDAFALGHATGLQTPEEIADLVVFLAGDASRSLTGALLTCDAGWTAFKQPDLLRSWSVEGG